MPLSQANWDNLFGNHLIAEQRAYDVGEQSLLAEDNIDRFNVGQTSSFEQIMDSVLNGKGRLFFLNGPGGTGKTFVYNTVCAKIRSLAKIVLCVASSGIAALLLSGGCTAHSHFKIPLNLSDTSTCPISKNSKEADLMRCTDCIIWDEAIMQHRHAFDAVDRLFQDVRDNSSPFGGVTVVFGGDFQQILPVILKGSRPDIVGACLQCSSLWPDITILSLTQNMQLGDDPEESDFAKWQLDVGHGRHTSQEGDIILPERIRCPENTIESLIQAIYPDIQGDHGDQYFKERTILSARNDDVDNLNHSLLQQFSGQEITFHSADSAEKERFDEGEDPMYPVEYLNSISASGLPLSKLKLKIGVPIMVLKNLDPASGVCNGSRGILTRASMRVLEVRLLDGDNAGQTVLIPRITLTPSNLPLPFQLRCRQFPVHLAFAMTVNKSQGQSVKYVGLDFRAPVFTHGQFYVAISQVTSVHRIKVIWTSTNNEPKTKNIVYPEVLLD